MGGSSGVEVKSEPLLMSTSHNQDDVPSSVASVSVTEFITTPEVRYVDENVSVHFTLDIR